MFVMFKIVQRKQIDAIAEYLINIFIFPFFLLFSFSNDMLESMPFYHHFDWNSDFWIFGANKFQIKWVQSVNNNEKT